MGITVRNITPPLALVLAAVSSLSVLASGCASTPGAEISTPVQEPGGFANHDLSVAYVGKEACRECHEGNYANFVRTGMGRSFYALTADNLVEDWTGNNEFTDPRTGLTYRMFERDGRFYQRQFARDSKGAEVAVDEYPLTYVVGSNNHSRGYIVVRDGKLFQAPICWDPTEKFWMYCPGYENKNDHFGRETSESCLFCHNGRVELVEGERNLYHEPLSMGIGCERCHGPGEAHVAYREDHSDPWDDPGQLDPTIVNPRQLPDDTRVQVCFQCHLGDPSATVRVVKHGQQTKDFRPGMPITDTFVPFRYVQPTVSSFSLVSQADRMLRSRCYLESEGKLECLTCHNPHLPVYERPPGAFRDNCRTCHDLTACSATDEARAATEPSDDCVACHMRRAEPNDRKFTVFTDHWIRRDALNPPDDRRTRFDLEPIFPTVFASYPEGERAYYLARAHYLRALSSAPSALEWHWARAEESFRDAIAKGFDVPDTWFFLGKVLMTGPNKSEALDAFRRVLTKDPEHHGASYAAAQMLADSGRREEAAALLEGMIERDPDDALALAELARVHWLSGDFGTAEGLYGRAVASEPWNPKFRLNLGMTLAAQGRMGEAADEGLRAVKLDPDSPEIWDFLRNAGREAGREELSQEAIHQLRKLR